MAKSGMSETIRADNPMDEPIKNHLSTITVSGFHKLPNDAYSIIKGIEITQSALAGVGTPLKLSDCLGSTLNLDKRKAEKTGINNGIRRIGLALKVSIPLISTPIELAK